jgi:hypothetical protein
MLKRGRISNELMPKAPILAGPGETGMAGLRCSLAHLRGSLNRVEPFLQSKKKAESNKLRLTY